MELTLTLLVIGSFLTLCVFGAIIHIIETLINRKRGW